MPTGPTDTIFEMKGWSGERGQKPGQEEALIEKKCLLYKLAIVVVPIRVFLLKLLSHHKAILVGHAITTFLEGLLKATNRVAVLIDYFTTLTRGIVGAVSSTPTEWPF